MPTILETQAIFFEAMRAGYANPAASKLPVEGMPGWKMTSPFIKGNWRVVDMWCTHPDSNRSSGITCIWFDDQVFWTMHYGGHYPEYITPFLKEALLSAYKTNSFFGGRGPRRSLGLFDGKEYEYINKGGLDFSNFSGEEQIVLVEKSKIVGRHTYFGVYLGF